jgi:archaellum component FlaC
MVVISKHLGGWETSTFGNVKRELKGLKEELERLRSNYPRLGPSHEEINIVYRIVELNHHED